MPATHYRVEWPDVTVRTGDAGTAATESRAGARVTVVTVGEGA